MDNGIKLYMKQHGDTVAGKKIEIIRKDAGGIESADVAKRLAQELIVRDKVDILAGFAADAERARRLRRLRRSQEVHGDHERGDLDHHRQVALLARARRSRCRMITVTLGTWAAKHGIKNAYTMVSDYGPGHDAEKALLNGFKAAGGKIVGSVRMPVANPDFSALSSAPRTSTRNRSSCSSRAARSRRPSARRLAERGMDAAEDQDLGHAANWPTNSAIKSMGDAAVGIITAWHLRLQSASPR